MQGGGGGGDGDDVSRPRPQAAARVGRRQHQTQTPSLPFDIVLEIASRSDPATLVRCAATCREARRRVADDDPAFRLRLRHTDRFVLPLLRGHLVRKYDDDTSKYGVCVVDTTAADATRLIKVSDRGFFGKLLKGVRSVSSREGLLLIRATNKQARREELRVCDPATRRSRILPPEPRFPHPHHVLLVGDGESGGDIGRPFQVLRLRLMTSDHCRSSSLLEIRAFSSEHGVWGPFTKIPTPDLLGITSSYHNPLVTDGVVHWFCLTGSGSYVLMLHVKAKRATWTTLPMRFPRDKEGRISYLVATDSPCGNPIVLVADEEKISMWVQSKHTKIWMEQPQVVIMIEEMLRFNNVGDLLEGRPEMLHVKLVWFSERSGVVLIEIPNWCFFWLDLQSKKIVRCPCQAYQKVRDRLDYQWI
ncbi:hypothetical protein EJB05_10710, partial [Eragrostis curvula]